jgi:2-polyprenyl-3-methyl-5-hydroxy-6-metoxy-1,4-benzoquinol methylase
MPRSPDVAAALTAVEALVRAAPVVITHQDSGLVDDEAAYLAFHRIRFRETLDRVAAAVPVGARVLDVGGQFLHLALALRELGYVVDAADIGPYGADSRLRARAGAGLAVHRIQSLAELEFPDATFNAVLLLEILEHLAQNPRPLWVELRRVLRPGGRVIVTTPNLYRVGGGGGAALQAWRLLTARGSGPMVEEVISLQTGAHHWKEYGRRELRRYFSLLGWRIERMESFNYLPSRRPWLLVLKRLFPALHDCLYLELLPA